ncbi:MAG TPA: response regulator [Pyrinomonadaceae bacterium]|jgi:CheY-like chemotaxis protein|nr:response regulator [Pyrinomonadaceae bacterium]
MLSEHLRVLYAENNTEACFVMKTILKFSDIDVTTVGTVAEACQLGQTENFDLYLLDSRFSDGSGLDLCRCLRRKSPRTPILFYSGDALKTDVQNGLAAGADAYMVKPYFEELTEKVLQLLKPLKNMSLKAALN